MRPVSAAWGGLDCRRGHLPERLCRRPDRREVSAVRHAGDRRRYARLARRRPDYLHPLPPDTLGVYVENGSDHTTTVLPMPTDGQLKYRRPIPAPTPIRRIGSGTSCLCATSTAAPPPLHQPRGRHLQQGCPVSDDRLPGSGSYPRLHVHHARGVQGGSSATSSARPSWASSAMNPTTPAPSLDPQAAR